MYDFTVNDVHCDKDFDVAGHCNGCGSTIYNDEAFREDAFDNKYHEGSCNENLCSFCGKTILRSELIEDQDDDMCLDCACWLGMEL